MATLLISSIDAIWLPEIFKTFKKGKEHSLISLRISEWLFHSKLRASYASTVFRHNCFLEKEQDSISISHHLPKFRNYLNKLKEYCFLFFYIASILYYLSEYVWNYKLPRRRLFFHPLKMMFLFIYNTLKFINYFQ